MAVYQHRGAMMEARVLGVRRPLQHERFSIEGILCEMVRLHSRAVPLQQHLPISALAFARWQDVSPSEGKASVLLRKADWPDHVSLEMPLRHLVSGSQVPHHTWPCRSMLPHPLTPFRSLRQDVTLYSRHLGHVSLSVSVAARDLQGGGAAETARSAAAVAEAQQQAVAQQAAEQEKLRLQAEGEEGWRSLAARHGGLVKPNP